MTYSFIDIDSRNRTFKLHISGITSEFYGADVRGLVDDQYSLGGVGQIGSVGIIGTGVTEWTSKTIKEYYREDQYTGNTSVVRFTSGEVFYLSFNLILASGADYMLASSAELVFTQEGLVPVVGSFSVRPGTAGNKRAYYTLRAENVYINKNDATTYFEIYVNDVRKYRYELGNTTERGSILFDNFGVYKVSVRIENIFSPEDGDPVYIYSDIVNVNVRVSEKIDISDCQIEYAIIDVYEFPSENNDVNAYVTNYVDITNESWTRFCDAINAVRTTVGLSEATFTSGDTLSAIMWNEAMEAFADAADELSCIFDTDKFSATRGMPIAKVLIDEVNSEIAAILEEIT